MPIGGLIGGISGGLGVASGAIRIDTSDLDRVVTLSRQVGQTVTQSLDTAGRGITGFTSTLRGMRTELLALGAASGILTAFGLNAARDLRNYRIAFDQLLGSQTLSRRVIDDLTESASEFGLELTGVLGLGRSLLPILEGNTEELDEWVKRAALLRSVFPAAQQGAEIRAIAEFISGQTVSLQRLFNIPPNLILEAQAAFSDLGQQLDFILQRMGATEDAARQMADPLVAVRNELQLIAAESFLPLLESIRPVLTSFREWLQDLRATRPEFLQTGAAIAAIATVGASGLLLLEKTLSTLIALKNLGVVKVGLAIGVAAGAAAATTAGLRAAGRATGDERLANITFAEQLRTALTAVSDLFFSFVALLGPVFQAIVQVGAALVAGLGGVVGAIGRVLTKIGGIIGGRPGAALIQQGADFQVAGAQIIDFARRLQDANQATLPGFMQRVSEARDAVREFIDSLFGIKLFSGGGQGPKVTERAQTPPPGVFLIPPDIAEILDSYYADIKAIERAAAAERLQITREYEAQRTQIIAAYERTIAREAEDFARQRARAEEDLQRQIDDIRQEQVEREAEWVREHEENINDIREDFQKQRERLERDHADNLFNAASRLDARAVAEENRRFGRAMNELNEQEQERIEQEEEAHRERLEQAREADDERIRDLEEFHRIRIQREDEDRAVRLRRMEEDHLRQLVEMETQHQARLAQIGIHAREERQELDDAYTDQLQDLGVYNADYLSLQADMHEESLALWREYWRDVLDTQPADSGGGGGGGGGGHQVIVYSNSGPTGGIAGTTFGPSQLPAATVASLATTSTPAPLPFGPATSTTNLGGTNAMTIEAGAIVINAPPGTTPGAIAAAIDERLRQWYVELNT